MAHDPFLPPWLPTPGSGAAGYRCSRGSWMGRTRTDPRTAHITPMTVKATQIRGAHSRRSEAPRGMISRSSTWAGGSRRYRLLPGCHYRRSYEVVCASRPQMMVIPLLGDIGGVRVGGSTHQHRRGWEEHPDHLPGEDRSDHRQRRRRQSSPWGKIRTNERAGRRVNELWAPTLSPARGRI